MALLWIVGEMSDLEWLAAHEMLGLELVQRQSDIPHKLQCDQASVVDSFSVRALSQT